MALTYGFVKCRVISEPFWKGSRLQHETQYHLHATLDVDGEDWDVAINVGTDDADDLLKYRLVYDFHHAIRGSLSAAKPGFADLTTTRLLPALDFVRGDILAETGKWRDSDVLDGSDYPEPVASLKRLLSRSMAEKSAVYVFGRTYHDGTKGIHDIHMNQGSTGRFLNNGRDDRNDHNDTWQDGAVLVDLGAAGWAGYFTAFAQQRLPTDDLGNPAQDSGPVG